MRQPVVLSKVRKSPPPTNSLHAFSHKKACAMPSTDHSKEDVLLVLEGIEELDEPVGFGGRQDIALDQDVTDLAE